MRALEDCMDDLTNAMRMLRPVTKAPRRRCGSRAHTTGSPGTSPFWSWSWTTPAAPTRTTTAASPAS